ncbi:hypothetical protein EFY79_05360 [Hanamia caeni]|uniref:Uncharacterized protein n=1 Tax=Hanamia caeni TaxID=2294116 RepID=A0A3M9NNJ5_9BACT|nr:DUF5995 family protein [Hanamia caeni]RNI39075.1 hypothetical protein EFY79_05360 [Hanamia caeni]
MNPVTTIDGVIAQLEEIIQWCMVHKSRIGYFAALYQRMTIAVKQAIIANEFQDAKRMEQLDIIFASRYFEAWNCYINQQNCSHAWQIAFKATDDLNLIVLQHLLLGINTHINLDLAIAAADCCPGDTIYDLQTDFIKINDIIEAESQLVQNSLTSIWPPLKLFADISNHREKAVLNFSIETARKCSWANAIVLANITADGKPSHISKIDSMVVDVARQIISPGVWMEFLLKPVRMMENPEIDKLIAMLKK